jgi:DNA-binding IclR family transcriptional regulator
LFLAGDDPQRIRAYAARTGLQGHTKNSLTRLEDLEKELSKVRQYGRASDNEELELGVRCLASGIYDDQGKLVAGLSISAPSGRMEDDWLPKLIETTRQISETLGHKPSKRT